MFHKEILTLLLFIFTSLAGCCFSDDSISNIEYSKYGQTYSDESLSQRLSRLESDFFGTVQTGDLDSRINKLNRISSNIVQNPQNIYYGSDTPEKKGFFRNLFDTFNSYNNYGTFTGYTPPLQYSDTLGYPQNIYRNSFSNYSNQIRNNYGNYCPFGQINNRRYNRINRNNFYRTPIKGRHYPPRYRYNRPYNDNYIPQDLATTFTTGSSVHIIRD